MFEILSLNFKYMMTTPTVIFPWKLIPSHSHHLAETRTTLLTQSHRTYNMPAGEVIRLGGAQSHETGYKLGEIEDNAAPLSSMSFWCRSSVTHQKWVVSV